MENQQQENKQESQQGNDKMMAILAYILFFVPLLVGKRSPFVTFHTNQGTILFIAAVVGNIVLGIIPIIGWMIMPFFQIAVLILAIMGIINVTKGKMTQLPVIGSYTIVK